MSGNFFARGMALTLAALLTACGGDDASAPIVNVGSGGSGTVTEGENTNTGGESSQQQAVLELGTGSEDTFQSGVIDLTATELSSGGSTRLDFNVVDASNGNALFGAEETQVTLTSTCDAAILNSPLTTTSGRVSTSYEAGCPGTDTITARVSGGATAMATVNVAPQEIGAIEFASATPQTIATLGSADSARASVSLVIFELVDRNGKPVVGQEVSFSVSTTVGGISITETSADTNSEGQAQTRVNAGTVATVVSVTATAQVDGDIIQTTSDPISVSAAIPDHDSFSISVAENFLPNARFYDGVGVPITIRAADRNNNLINDTIVNFVASGGAVPNECTLEAGVCSITWTSQDPKQPDNGIIAILARTVGEESYRDLNSNGQYDAGIDLFIPAEHDAPEAYLDRSGNESRNNDEEWFDYNANGTYDAADGIYDGMGCSAESEASNSCTKTVKEIFELAYVYATSDDLLITPTTLVTAPGEICITIAGVFTDSNGLTVQGPPPGGTEVGFETTNGSIVGESSFNTTTNFTTQPVQECILTEADAISDSGTLTVTVTPSGSLNERTYIERYTITD